MVTTKLPLALPPRWFAEDDWRGTLLHAVDGNGHIVASVTVNETVRGYLTGVQTVPAFHGRAERYMRRGWRRRLYEDALAALMSAWRALQPSGPQAAAHHGRAAALPGKARVG